MKKYIVLFLLFSTVVFAQNVNDYKYALMPSKFSFLKEENQYNLNLITKMYLQKYGFESYYDNETFSADFASINCNKIFIDVLNNSTMFSTKLKVVIKDCKNNILAISDEGTSREKEYRVAYNEALRMAFDNFGMLKTHKYQPSEKSIGTVGELAFQEVEHNEGKPMILYPKKAIEGFDLITSNPEVVYMNIKYTSVKDVYIAKRKENKGIFFKDNEKWIFEYYLNNQKITELLHVQL
jgi:hypothetical protein